MNITEEQMTQMTRIYNTLLTVSTKGEDTIIMANCISALQQVLVEISNANTTNIEMIGE